MMISGLRVSPHSRCNVTPPTCFEDDGLVVVNAVVAIKILIRIITITITIAAASASRGNCTAGEYRVNPIIVHAFCVDDDGLLVVVEHVVVVVVVVVAISRNIMILISMAQLLAQHEGIAQQVLHRNIKQKPITASRANNTLHK